MSTFKVLVLHNWRADEIFLTRERVSINNSSLRNSSLRILYKVLQKFIKMSPVVGCETDDGDNEDTCDAFLIFVIQKIILNIEEIGFK